MQNITLDTQLEDGFTFNVSELEVYLRRIPDSRKARGKIYPLSMLLTMIILAKLAGEDKPSAITDWIKLRKKYFVLLFGCKHARMPCLNTIRTILQDVVSSDELEKVFKQFLHEKFGGQQSELITLDGKTMRGTIPKGETQGIHLLTAYLPEEGIVLKQVEVDGKTNEITAAPEVLEGIDMKNKVVCADAMQTQRNFSAKVIGGGGDYILTAKDNQKRLLADIKQFFEKPEQRAGWHNPPLPNTTAQQSGKGHGRIERRELTLIADAQRYLDWPGIQQVFKLERYVKHLRTDKETRETIYGLTSCTPEKGTAQKLLAWTRNYWGIENGLHYRRDVTLQEDATRMSNSKMAKVVATINNFVIGLARKLGYGNLASARCQFDVAIAMQLLSFADY